MNGLPHSRRAPAYMRTKPQISQKLCSARACLIGNMGSLMVDSYLWVADYRSIVHIRRDSSEKKSIIYQSMFGHHKSELYPFCQYQFWLDSWVVRGNAHPLIFVGFCKTAEIRFSYHASVLAMIAPAGVLT